MLEAYHGEWEIITEKLPQMWEKDDIALALGVKQQKEGVRSQRNCIRY